MLRGPGHKDGPSKKRTLLEQKSGKRREIFLLQGKGGTAVKERTIRIRLRGPQKEPVDILRTPSSKPPWKRKRGNQKISTKGIKKGAGQRKSV